MLKVAIVGCGKIADSHAAAIKRIDGCEIVAACDREELMAAQFADRFGVRQTFSDIGKMLHEARPDVVHITTTPQSHFAIAHQCLEYGCHVYVEKPFTLDATEAEALIGLAERRGLKLTAGHDDQFRHAARRMRQRIQQGYLGGPPVHLESYYCYDLGDGGYARALLADKQHWVRQLPGGLLQNVISHGIARIAEFLPTDHPTVIAHGHTSPKLRRMGEREIIDELRVIIDAGGQMTAYFTFSSQMRPSLHELRVYGPKNGLVIDLDQETMIELSGRRRKSYLEQFVSPLVLGRQYAANFRRNVGLFLAADFHAKAGMKYLMESFYKAIAGAAPLPISYREILLTARIMDEIFRQLAAQQAAAAETSDSDDFRVAATAT